MPETRDYADVQVRAANISFSLHARLLHAAHKCIAAGHSLAVSWPDWKESNNDFGQIFRVFGSPSSLDVFTLSVAELVEHNLVYVVPPQKTPESTATIIFYRNRSAEKSTEGFIARENRHREARNIAPTRRVVFPGKRPRSLIMQSGSTKNAFSIYIEKEMADGSTHTSGKSYGLGIPVPHF